MGDDGTREVDAVPADGWVQAADHLRRDRFAGEFGVESAATFGDLELGEIDSRIFQRREWPDERQAVALLLLGLAVAEAGVGREPCQHSSALSGERYACVDAADVVVRDVDTLVCRLEGRLAEGDVLDSLVLDFLSDTCGVDAASMQGVEADHVTDPGEGTEWVGSSQVGDAQVADVDAAISEERLVGKCEECQTDLLEIRGAYRAFRIGDEWSFDIDVHGDDPAKRILEELGYGVPDFPVVCEFVRNEHDFHVGFLSSAGMTPVVCRSSALPGS